MIKKAMKQKQSQDWRKVTISLNFTWNRGSQAS